MSIQVNVVHPTHMLNEDGTKSSRTFCNIITFFRDDIKRFDCNVKSWSVHSQLELDMIVSSANAEVGTILLLVNNEANFFID